MNNVDNMSKEALRAACKDAGVKYGKMNNTEMRAALKAGGYTPAEVISAAPAAADVAVLEDEREEEGSAPAPAIFSNMVGNDKLAAAIARSQPTQKPKLAEVERDGLKIQKDRAEANGVKRPSAGGICDQVWILAEANQGKRFKEILEIGQKQGINIFTIRTQYARWRKFNGISR